MEGLPLVCGVAIELMFDLSRQHRGTDSSFLAEIPV
jgi:hypothetical protein